MMMIFKKYRTSWFTALLFTLIPIGIGFLTGWGSVDTVSADKSMYLGVESDRPFSELFVEILLMNLRTLISLFSGVLTFGISSEIFGMLFGMFMGATVSVSAENIGGIQLLINIWPYFLLEMLAFVVAAVAGSLPGARALFGKKDPGNTTEKFYLRYLYATRISLRLFFLSFVLLALGALVESILIVAR